MVLSPFCILNRSSRSNEDAQRMRGAVSACSERFPDECSNQSEDTDSMSHCSSYTMYTVLNAFMCTVVFETASKDSRTGENHIEGNH